MLGSQVQDMKRDEIYNYTNTEKFHYNWAYGTYDSDEKKKSVLIWNNIQSEYIKEALKSSNLQRSSLCGYGTTQHGKVGYIFFTAYTKDQIIARKLPHWLVILLCPKELTTIMSGWYKLARQQNELVILLEENNNKHRVLLAVSQEDYKQFVKDVDSAISEWSGTNNSADLIRDMELAFMQEIQNIEKSLIEKYSYKFNAELALLEEIKKRIIKNIDQTEFIHKLASSNDNLALYNYLQSLAENIPENMLNEFVSNKGSSFFDDIYRTWLFGQKCFEAGREISNDRVFIANGLTDNGTWLLRENPKEINTSEEIFDVSERYRYLLKRNWNNLILENEILFTTPDLLKFCNLGVLPKRSQFDQLSRILQLAALEQQYSIEYRSIIELNKQGCVEIEYLPVARNGLESLFKVLILKGLDCNQCLVGELNAVDGYIAFINSPNDESVKDYLRLMLFIVAVAFRDLIVAREKLRKGGSTREFKNGTRKNKSQSNLTPLRYIPRIKGEIDGNFANPNRLVKRLKEIAPHTRVAHLRGLPSGYKNSEKAKRLANEYGWTLPEGKTFVSSSHITPSEGADPEVIRSRFRSISLLEILF